MKKILLLLLISSNIYSQNNRMFRLSLAEDIIHYNHIYKEVNIGHPDSQMVWLLSDIIINNEIPYILDKTSQRNCIGIGNIISATTDSSLFNYEASLKVCPNGFRIPTYKEFENLMLYLNIDQKFYFFKNLNGFIGYNNKINKDSTIVKNTNRLPGGFYWTSTIENGKYVAIMIDEKYRNMEKGYVDIWDGLSVRCIKNDEDE